MFTVLRFCYVWFLLIGLMSLSYRVGSVSLDCSAEDSTIVLMNCEHVCILYEILNKDQEKCEFIQGWSVHWWKYCWGVWCIWFTLLWMRLLFHQTPTEPHIITRLFYLWLPKNGNDTHFILVLHDMNFELM